LHAGHSDPAVREAQRRLKEEVAGISKICAMAVSAVMQRAIAVDNLDPQSSYVEDGPSLANLCIGLEWLFLMGCSTTQELQSLTRSYGVVRLSHMGFAALRRR
jgi:hypothetical protein